MDSLDPRGHSITQRAAVKDHGCANRAPFSSHCENKSLLAGFLGGGRGGPTLGLPEWPFLVHFLRGHSFETMQRALSPRRACADAPILHDLEGKRDSPSLSAPNQLASYEGTLGSTSSTWDQTMALIPCTHLVSETGKNSCPIVTDCHVHRMTNDRLSLTAAVRLER